MAISVWSPLLLLECDCCVKIEAIEEALVEKADNDDDDNGNCSAALDIQMTEYLKYKSIHVYLSSKNFHETSTKNKIKQVST